jgi:hypothetical protein
MFLSNIEINISNSIFFCKQQYFFWFTVLYRLFITRRFYPTYAPGEGQLRVLLYTDTGLHFDKLLTYLTERYHLQRLM